MVILKNYSFSPQILVDMHTRKDYVIFYVLISIYYWEHIRYLLIVRQSLTNSWHTKVNKFPLFLEKLKVNVIPNLTEKWLKSLKEIWFLPLYGLHEIINYTVHALLNILIAGYKLRSFIPIKIT